MALHIGEDGLHRLKQEKAWSKLAPEQQTAWEAIFTERLGETHEYGWAEQFTQQVAKTHPAAGKVPKPLVKAIITAFGERDPEGDIVMKDGAPVPDDELSDFENVPMGKDVRDYLAEDVLPHAPDAFIDEGYCDESDGAVGVVGYEINFNRYFYEYQAPRDLKAIDADLKAIEAEIAAILNEVTE